MRCTLQMGDALAIVHRRAANDAVHFVSFAEKEFGEVAAVLACNTGDKRFFHDAAIRMQGCLNENIIRFRNQTVSMKLFCVLLNISTPKTNSTTMKTKL